MVPLILHRRLLITTTANKARNKEVKVLCCWAAWRGKIFCFFLPIDHFPEGEVMSHILRRKAGEIKKGPWIKLRVQSFSVCSIGKQSGTKKDIPKKHKIAPVRYRRNLNHSKDQSTPKPTNIRIPSKIRCGGCCKLPYFLNVKWPRPFCYDFLWCCKITLPHSLVGLYPDASDGMSGRMNKDRSPINGSLQLGRPRLW